MFERRGEGRKAQSRLHCALLPIRADEEQQTLLTLDAGFFSPFCVLMKSTPDGSSLRSWNTDMTLYQNLL